jgi:hypothetical protein|tara:strand:+ start:857 stop:1930 length:1074 start_codon:yes stop_codon:yes gene_type:complete
MEPYELLDRFELLYPTNTKLADLRRTYIDQDLTSIFRLSNTDDNLRKAVVEQNLHSIFRLLEGEVNGELEEFRKAVVEQNLHSIFRLSSDENENLRKAVVEQNLHSIFRLVDDEDLRKLVLEDNIWKLWPILDRYVDTQFVAAFKNFFVNETKIWNDSFSRGQIKSKQWVIKELTKLNLDLGTVFLCAGWYATLATMLFESKVTVGKIRSFDIDPSCAKIAEVFNKPWFEEDWRFKASTVDIMDFEWTDVPAPSDGTMGNFYYMTSASDKHIQMKDNPDTIINTSCEHIANFDEWYNNIPDGKLVILQSNDYFEIEEHVNCHKTISQFSKSTPMKETLFEGQLFLPDYTRFMKIGYK